MVTLVAASLCSYVFLHVASVKAAAAAELNAITVEQPADKLGEANNEALLPDVTLFKRVFSLGKHFIPGL